MPDLVGLQGQTPDAFERLNSLLSIKRQQTALGVEQRKAAQGKALSEYDWNQHVGEDGLLDLPSLNNPALRAAAGDQYLEVLQHAAQTKAGQLDTQGKLLAVRTDQRAALAAMLNGLRSDADVANDTPAGRQKVTEALVQYGEQNGPDVLPVLASIAPKIQGVGQGKLNDALRNIGLQAQTLAEQRSAQAPTMLDTGAAVQNINPNAIPSASIPKSIAPGFTTATDAAGNPVRVDAQTNTATPTGGGLSPTAAPSAPLGGRYQGQEADVARNQTEVADVRKAADLAPTQRNTFQNILRLADDTNTGPLVKFVQDTKIGGQAFGDNYQELGKFLERNAINAMQAMGGGGSDARLEAAVKANGSTEFNPQALRAVTEFNYAANTGLERYRAGIDNAIGTENPDYRKLAEFKKNWAANFDVDAFRLENALEDGDKKGQDAVLKNLSSAQRVALARKMENLDALSDTGRLP